MQQTIRKIAPGTLLHGRYEVIKTLGWGAVGTAVLAADRELDGQMLVLKILHEHLASEPSTLRRFNAEAMLGRQISHPNVARLYDVVSDGDVHFLTMEYVEGCTLQELLLGAPNRRLPLDESLHILMQALAALVAAHAQGVTHRDLKPANLLVDRSGTVKLVDFGLAKGIESAHGLTRTGELIGTPVYMAPEQFANLSDPRTDLYAWSILAFELICGRVPFTAESSVALMQKHRTQPYPYETLLAAGCPEWFADLLRTCAEKDPAHRPHSSRHVLTVIQERHHPATPEQAQRGLINVVKRRQRSHHLLPDSAKFWTRGLWILTVLVATGGVLNERISRERMASRAVQVYQLTGITMNPVLAALGFGKYRGMQEYDLLAAVADQNLYATRMLLAAGIGPDVIDAEGNPIFHRLLAGPANFIDPFCIAGADLEAVGANGETALLEAVRRGLAEHIGKLVLYGASLHARDRFGNTPILLAIAQGDERLINALTFAPVPIVATQRERSNEGLNALHLAVENQRWNIVKQLLKLGFDADIRDGNGTTTLMRIVALPYSEESKQMFALLLKRGAEAQARDNDGRGLLDYATSEWKPKVVGLVK